MKININRLYRRVGAYLIDIIAVAIIISAFSSISFFNPYKDEYNEVYYDYMDIVEEYQDEDITEDEYREQVREISYEIEKYSTYSASISVIVYLLYFVGFGYVTKGQTLGKKLLKLRVVSNKEKDNPKIWRYLVRALIVYGLVFKIINIVLVNTLGIDSYFRIYNVIYYIQYFVEIVIMVMLFVNQDGRSLHDIVAGTVVIDNNSEEVLEEVKEESKEKIIDAEYKELDKKKKIKKESE